jgi:hypothetical protein
MRERNASGTDLYLHELWRSADRLGRELSRTTLATANLMSLIAALPMLVLFLLNTFTYHRLAGQLKIEVYLIGAGLVLFTRIAARAPNNERIRPEGWRFSALPPPKRRRPPLPPGATAWA